MNPFIPNWGDITIIAGVSLVLSLLIRDVTTLMVYSALAGAAIGFWRANKNSEGK